jgi:hypothetical protein
VRSRFGVAVTFVLGLSACAGYKTAGHFIDRGQRELERGELSRAEESFSSAISRAEGNEWVLAAAKRGIAQVKLAWVRESLKANSGSDAAPGDRLAQLHAERIAVREYGGDEAVDAQLVERMVAIGTEVVSSAERATGGARFPATLQARAVLAYPGLPQELQERAAELQNQAAAAHQARADQAGAAHPLARRAHAGFAARFTGGTRDDASALTATFAPSVVVATAGAGCSGVADRVAGALERSGSERRRADVEITYTSCQAETSSTPTSGEIKWQEEEDYIDTGYEEKKQCGTYRVRVSDDSCFQSSGHEATVRTCIKGWKYEDQYSCEIVQVPYSRPAKRPVTRTGERPGTITTMRMNVAGNFVVHRGGFELRGDFNTSVAVSGTVFEAYRDLAASGEAPRIGALHEDAADDVTEAVRVKLAEAFGGDIASAASDARYAGADGRIDDEEEAWIRAALLGGSDVGPLTERYGVTPDSVRAAFASDAISYPSSPVLPEVTVYVVPPRRDNPRIPRGMHYDLVRRLPPTYAKHARGQFGLTKIDVPTATHPAMPGVELGGDSGYMFGVDISFRILGSRKPWGMKLVDDLGGTVGAGARSGGPDLGTGAALFAGGHYALGLGYRKQGYGALLGGVRGEAGAFHLGSTTGHYVTAPVFGRLEITLRRGTLSFDGFGASVYGNAHVGGGLSFNTQSKYDWSAVKVFSVQLDRRAVDASLAVAGDMMPDAKIDDLELTTVMFLFGGGI